MLSPPSIRKRWFGQRFHRAGAGAAALRLPAGVGLQGWWTWVLPRGGGQGNLPQRGKLRPKLGGGGGLGPVGAAEGVQFGEALHVPDAPDVLLPDEVHGEHLPAPVGLGAVVPGRTHCSSPRWAHMPWAVAMSSATQITGALTGRLSRWPRVLRCSGDKFLHLFREHAGRAGRVICFRPPSLGGSSSPMHRGPDTSPR